MIGQIKLLVIVCALMTNVYSYQDPHFNTGSELLDGIRFCLRLNEEEVLSPAETLEATRALSYLTGFIDALIINQAALGKKITDLGSGRYTLEQQMRVVKVYLEKNPEHLHKSPRACVYMALVEAFPPD